MPWLKTFSLCLVSLAVFPWQLQGGDQVDINTVFRAWKERQESLRSFKFKWVRQRVVTQGAWLPGPGSPAVFPPEDTVFEDQFELWMEGERVKQIADEKLHWSPETKRLLPYHRENTLNEKAAKGLFKPEGNVPEGSTAKAKAVGPAWFLTTEVLALAVNCRPLSPNWCAFRPDQFRVLGKKGILPDKKVSLILEQKDPHPDIVHYWWAIPEYGYLIGRYQQTVNGKLIDEVTISYLKDDTSGFLLPSAWKLVNYYSSGDKIRETCNYRVTSSSVNIPFKESDFDLVFPVGAVITDHDEKRTYIVQEGGGKRYLSDREQKLPAEQFRKLVEKASQKSPLFWVVGTLLVLVMIILVAIKILRIRKTST